MLEDFLRFRQKIPDPQVRDFKLRNRIDLDVLRLPLKELDGHPDRVNADRDNAQQAPQDPFAKKLTTRAVELQATPITVLRYFHRRYQHFSAGTAKPRVRADNRPITNVIPKCAAVLPSKRELLQSVMGAPKLCGIAPPPAGMGGTALPPTGS